jgi:micrococcal nuclease
MDIYVYKANVTKVYDGDTITCDIDCGFGVVLMKQKIRLYGLNAPEVRGVSNEQGIITRDKLRERILDKEIRLKTIKDKKGKYGRYIATVYLDSENINDWLVENNLAVKAEY